jgi:hypothetical protein
MFVIENEKHEAVADGRGRQLLQSLSVVYRPDGGLTLAAKVNQALHDENGQTLKICEVIEPIEGKGSVFSKHGPLSFKDGKWLRPRLMVDPPAQPTTEEVLASEAYDLDQCHNKRRAEYPSIEDQMDLQFHDAKDGTTKWQEAVQAVKTKWPTPAEIAAKKAAEEAAAKKAAEEAAAKKAAEEAAAKKAAEEAAAKEEEGGSG